MTVSLSDVFARAAAHHQAGRLAEAASLYRELIAADAHHADAHRLLGALLLQQKKARDALPLLERALQLGATDAATRNNLALAYIECERFEDALAQTEAALMAKPDYPGALNNRGLALLGLKHLDAARASFESALGLQPDFADALINLGKSYVALQRLDDAVALYSKLLTLPAQHEVARFNRAKTLAGLGLYDEALADYDAVRTQAGAQSAAATLAIAMIKLLRGQFDAGWPLYESRWQADPKLRPRAFAQPLWTGETSLAGKTILLHAEQGFGDTLQFIRYVPMVRARAGKTLLIVQPQLLPLLQPLWPHVPMFADAKTLPAFDLHCPLMSLPLAFKTTLETIPADVPYIKADATKRSAWRAKVGGAARRAISQRNVGIAWSGRPTHVNDINRSMGMETATPLLKVPAAFHALQNDISAADRAKLTQLGVSLHDQDLKDFSDTAALIDALDLVITVDTSLAHLAGAMGKPVWILLPFDPDFRWLLGRDDSPWYPTARLYRQAKPGDWASVIQRVVTDLKAI